MKLVLADDVTLIGVMKTRRVIRPNSGGQPFVKATVLADDESEVQIVWWDAGRAPGIGTRVKVTGRVREYNGGLEVHAQTWATDRKGPPGDPLAQVIGFYIGCVEAEAAGAVRVHPGSSGHVELIDGPSPVHSSRELPLDETVLRWCQHRQMAIGESILSGWPMIIGRDSNEGTAGLVASPLLISEVRLDHVAGLWKVQPVGGAVDLNPYALDLLSIDRDERDALVRLVEESPAVEEARLPEDRASSILSVLMEGGVNGLDGIDPRRLHAHDGLEGVHNTGLLIVAAGSTRITRMLLEDLEELMNSPELLSVGPTSVMLGQSPAPAAPLPEPHPTVVPSTVVQDQAVTAAMENVLTVVTGPPGTGKSQVLVNVVAAAVARGETVLFASKNNQAVDVVFDRIALTSPDACVVRAGASSLRSEVAASITRMLSTPRRSVDPALANHNWAQVKEQVGAVHGVLQRRARLEGELGQLQTDRGDLLESLPQSVVIDANRDDLDVGLQRVKESVAAFGRRLGLFGRWRKHEERLEQARIDLRELGELVGLDKETLEEPLRSVIEKPKRTLLPREDLGAIEEIVNVLDSVHNASEEISRTERELTGLTPKHELDDRLYALSEERITAGRALLDARWEQIRRNNPVARTAAGQLAETLEKVAANSGQGARRARGLIGSALPAVPVWGVTNLSARTNLPLISGLFDLVVIDEASQCDVASALPLLARARRAMIIGDRRQLIHITSLGRARELMVAKRWGLSDDRADEFSYRSRSCFGLASSRVDESPLFLDLHFRSHPAIIGFSNDHFYDGRLELCSESRPPGDASAIEWRRVDGDSRKGPRGRSRVNPVEAKALASLLSEDINGLRGLGLTVGVVTPYRAQVELIRDHLNKSLEETVRRRVTVSTAHRFQGDERDVIYFSPVVGPSMTQGQATFAADPNLLNVALTRARRRLVIVGNIEACLQHHNVLAALARYVSRLEAGAFDSPLEQALHEYLLDRGVPAETGIVVAGHRLDLAITQGSHRLDVECDGAAFHTDRVSDSARDRDIEADGWQVIRFSGRRLSRDLESCVDEVLKTLG